MRMPVIIFEGPRLTAEQKEELVRQFTVLASKVTTIPERAFTVLIKENDPQNVGVGGELLSGKSNQ